MKLPKRVFTRMDHLLPADKTEEFLATPAAELWRFNFGFGTMVRLKLLAPGKRLHTLFEEQGCSDRDIMTMILLEEYQKYLRKQKQAGESQ